jgi:hypothetical protein
MTNQPPTKLIITGLLAICLVLLGTSVYYATRNSNNSVNKNSLTKVISSGDSIPVELSPAAIPQGYPQKLVNLKRNSDKGIQLNIGFRYDIPLEEQNKPVKYPNKYLNFFKINRGNNQISNIERYENSDLINSTSYDTQKASADIKIQSINNILIKNIGNYSQSNIISKLIYLNKNLNKKDSINENGAFTNPGDLENIMNEIKENVIWYGFDSSSGGNMAKGVAIYTKNLNAKGLMGTYLRDYETQIDTKISNLICTGITFTNDNFVCLTEQENLVNLNTGEEFGKYNQFIDTNDGYLYAKDVDNTMIHKVELNNPKNATKISNIKENETISHFSFTSQKELLVQVTTSTPQSGILPPKITARTIELKNDGSVLERPEFKDVKIFI